MRYSNLMRSSIFMNNIFFQLNHNYPTMIVLYRDGVSDGQLPYVAQHEVAQLLSAFKSIHPSFEPKFTMVVVQKRINARFFMSTVT